MIKIPSHIDYYVACPRNFMNDTAVILDNNITNYYYEDYNQNEDKTFIQLHSSVMIGQLFAQSNTNLNSSLQCMQPGLSPCGFDLLVLVVLWTKCSISHLPRQR